MKSGVVVADTGPIFSLAVIDKLELLNSLFEKIYIPEAVWKEVTQNESVPFYNIITAFFYNKVEKIHGFNDLTFVMDHGESESVILYKEIKADYLLIDDKKARSLAENFGINCIGTLGLLSISKDKGLITSLKPLFEIFLTNKRYYSVDLLNIILKHKGEEPFNS